MRASCYWWGNAGKEIKAAIKQQVFWQHKDLSGTNIAASLVYEFHQRKLLAKMGYSFDVAELEQFEADAFALIESEFNKLAKKDLKKKTPKKGKSVGKSRRKK